MPNQVADTIDDVIREHRGRILASLIGDLRNFTLAEDVLQDAVVAALQHWPERGIPVHPDAWLLQVARCRAVDVIRRDRSFDAKRDELTIALEHQLEPSTDDEYQAIVDRRLELIFTCCHPSLKRSAQVALTLRTLGGLTTAEIASAFLVPETTMAQRLVRAQRKIRAAGIPFRVPPPHLWAERLNAVLEVIYLIFNEGYSASSGAAVTREDLCVEAIRLARLLVQLAPQETEAVGLLSLMLLHDSRRDARLSDTGAFVRLEDQDRQLWCQERIGEGVRMLKETMALGRIGPYQIQAAISALHAEAPSYAATNWQEITLLYFKLYQQLPSPVVRLNAAVALSMSEGVDAGLAALADLAEEQALRDYQPYHAARADLLARAGRHDEAAGAFVRAIALTDNVANRVFLQGRLRALQTLSKTNEDEDEFRSIEDS